MVTCAGSRPSSWRGYLGSRLRVMFTLSRSLVSRSCQWADYLGLSWTTMLFGILYKVWSFSSRYFVLFFDLLSLAYFFKEDNARPTIPDSRFNAPALGELLRACWDNDPAMRPSFNKIVLDIRLLRKSFGSVEETVQYSPTPRLSEEYESRRSPDLKPFPKHIDIPRAYTHVCYTPAFFNLNASQFAILALGPPLRPPQRRIRHRPPSIAH